MVGGVCSGMVRDATRVHLVGFAWVLGVAVILLLLLFFLRQLILTTIAPLVL